MEQKGRGSPEGLTLGDLSTLHFSVLESNWRENRKEKEAGEGTLHSRPHVLGDPKSSRTACHVSKPKLTCFIRAPPPPRPRPGPPGPSPCSGCGACLQRQRILYTIQGAVPMIRLQGSKLLLKPCYHIETHHFFSSSFTGSFRAPPLRAPPRSLSLEGWRGGRARGRVWGGGAAVSSPGSPIGGSGQDFRFLAQPQLGTPPR